MPVPGRRVFGHQDSELQALFVLNPFRTSSTSWKPLADASVVVAPPYVLAAIVMFITGIPLNTFSFLL